MRSYMSDRTVLVPNGATATRMAVYCGVPQVSVLGPALWNLFYDGLLRLRLPPRSRLIGFADDVAVVITRHPTEELERTAATVIDGVIDWMKDHGLELATTKTEAIVLTARKAFRSPCLTVGEHAMTAGKTLKYLGVWLDPRRTFTGHLREVSKRAGKSAAAVARLMPNMGGPSAAKRRLLTTVAESRLLYAAPV